MAGHAPPPPYSETDIFSNAGSHAPLATEAHPSSPPQTDTASIASSVLYTPPYTPAEEIDPLYLSPAQLYFDSRPVAYRAVGPTYSHELTATAHSRFEDFPYEATFGDRDITAQDWATFINFLVPQHIDAVNENVASEKMKAELLDERMRRLTIDGEKRSLDMTNVDAQLGQLAPRMDPTEEIFDIKSVVQQWNTGFFEPRGMRIMAHDYANVEHPPIVLSDETPEARPYLSAASESAEPAGPSLHSGPNFWQARRQLSSETNAGRRHGRPRAGGWGDHGPDVHGSRECGGRGSHAGRGYRMSIPDHDEVCRGCRRCGQSRTSTNENEAHSRNRTRGEFNVHQGEGFRLGPIVADDSGVRIGSMMRASSEGVTIGPLFVGKSPPNESGDEDSECSTASHESEGSIPDLDSLTPRQLPVLKQSLMDWLNHPEQPVSKAQIKQLKSNLKLTQADKTTLKPDKETIAQVMADLKEMKKQFKQAKKMRRETARQVRREKRQKRREGRRNRRQAHHEERQAQRRDALSKGKGKAISNQAAREAAAMQMSQDRDESLKYAQQARDAAQKQAQRARDAGQLHAQQARDAAQIQAQRARDAGQLHAQQARVAAQTYSQNIQQQVRQGMNGFLGLVPPQWSGRNQLNQSNSPRGPFIPFRGGRGSAWPSMNVLQPRAGPAFPNITNTPNFVPSMPTQPTMPSAPSTPNVPLMPRHESVASTHSNHSDLADNVAYLRSEAARHISEAETLRASAEAMRTGTQNSSFDEKTRVKLSYDAADLETEAARLTEEAEGQLAQALQIEEDEEERGRMEGRGYLRRMRETGGVLEKDGVVV